MKDFEAMLLCNNCNHTWADAIKNTEDYSIIDMMEIMLSLWIATGCPDCGWTELSIKAPETFACGCSFFDGIRGEDGDGDDEVTIKRDELDFLLEQAGFLSDEEGELEY